MWDTVSGAGRAEACQDRLRITCSTPLGSLYSCSLGKKKPQALGHKMFRHLPGGQYWKIKEGRGNAYIKRRLGTNTFTSNSVIRCELKLPSFSLKKSQFLALKEPKGHVELLKAVSKIPGTAHAADDFSSWMRQYATWTKASFWLPDLYQCRALLNGLNVKIRICWYPWKDRRICPSNDLGHCYRNSFTSQAFPRGAQSQSNCQQFPSITKIDAKIRKIRE